MSVTLTVLLWASLALVIISKLCDAISTIRHIPANAESNPWAGPLMRRYGVRRVCWAVFAIVVMVSAIVGIAATLTASTLYAILVCLAACFVSYCQFAAAYANRTGHFPPLMRRMLALYHRLSR